LLQIACVSQGQFSDAVLLAAFAYKRALTLGAIA